MKNMKFYRDTKDYKYHDYIAKNNVTAIYHSKSNKIVFYSKGRRHNTKNAAVYYYNNLNLKFFFLNGKIFRNKFYPSGDYDKKSWRQFVKMLIFS